MRVRRASGVERSAGAQVGRGVVLAARGGGRIVLGPTAIVGDRCELRAAPGATVTVHGTLEERCRIVARSAITVEAGAHLGAECALLDAGPVFDDSEVPVRAQGLRAAPILVAAGAVLGPRVAVLSGVTVGAGATITIRATSADPGIATVEMLVGTNWEGATAATVVAAGAGIWDASVTLPSPLPAGSAVLVRLTFSNGNVVESSRDAFPL